MSTLGFLSRPQGCTNLSSGNCCVTAQMSTEFAVVFPRRFVKPR